ncbi:MAG: hypothetical protein N3A68_08595 [Bacteroidia bacterium]|nr:hypothetical protein [Bacteroidia bacterium]
MTPPTGWFVPEALYWQGALLRGVSVHLQEGKVVEITHASIPDALQVEGLLTPAWVNAHTHLELSHLRGKLPRGRGMVDFLEAMGPGRGQASPEIIYQALHEAAQAGTWAFVSHQNVPLPPEAIPSRVQVYPLTEYFGLRRNGARRRWKALRRWGYPLTPHSFYALSRPLLRRVRRFTAFPRSLHFYESVEERLWLEGGKGPFKRFFRRFVARPYPPRWRYWLSQAYRRTPALWLIHAAELPASLAEILLHRYPRLYFVLCPEANAYLFRRGPALRFWRRYPHRLLLGTDSLANSPSLSVWEPLRRLLLAGFHWEEALLAVVDTPRRWVAVPPFWVQVAPLSEKLSLLPQTQPKTFALRATIAEKGFSAR